LVERLETRKYGARRQEPRAEVQVTPPGIVVVDA